MDDNYAYEGEGLYDESHGVSSGPFALSTVTTSTDTEHRQILHTKIAKCIPKHKLFYQFNKRYLLDNYKKLEYFLFDIFKDYGELHKLKNYQTYEYAILNSQYLVKFFLNPSSLSSYELDVVVCVNDIKVSDSLLKRIDKDLEDLMASTINVKIRWHYSKPGHGIQYTSFTSNFPFDIPEVNYPYVPNIDTFIDRYYKSSSSILLLLGEPGTGKTRFIRYLLANFSKYKVEELGVYFTVDPTVVADHSFFMEWLNSSYETMVMEDMDNNLSARKDGNQVMYQLLNFSDGLVEIENKKIILSTNLPNVSSVDDALLRSGRCFDLVHFQKLTWEQSLVFLTANNCTGISEVKEQPYTLSDLYSIVKGEYKEKEKAPAVGGVGFSS